MLAAHQGLTVAALLTLLQANAQQQALAFVFFLIFPIQHQIIHFIIYFSSKSVLVSIFY
jgi:hypothetical protein